MKPRRLQLLGRTLILISAIALVTDTMAQSVIVPPPTMPRSTVEPASPATDTNLVDSTASDPMPGGAVPDHREPMRWGPVVFHPYISYSFLHSTGVPLSTNVQKDTSIHQIAPGIALDIGEHWILDYSPTVSLYTESAFRDTVNHSVDLKGRTEYEDWTFALAQKCLLTSDPIAETAQQTDKEAYMTAFDVGYQLNAGLSLDINFRQNIWFSQAFTNSANSSFDWSLMNWLSHAWGPNLSAGAGIGVGFVDVGIGPDMTYEQFQLRASWKVARKITLSINGGIEVRQFLSSSTSDLITPVMGAMLEYRPFEQTTISLSADRSVNPSYFQSQVTATTRITGTINQRLFKRLYLGVSGGFANTTYESSQGPDANREDNYDFASASLSMSFLRRASVSVFATTSRNESSDGGFTYNSNQAGVQVAYRY